MPALKIGLIGCGVIAQVMHLHFLAELPELFKIAAVCDVSRDVAHACAGVYRVPLVTQDWRELLAAPLDAVMVLTPGSHAPIAIAAAAAGKHVFVEKPLCFSPAEGRAMIAAADQAGIVMLVGYNKRYDPAYERLQAEMAQVTDLRLARVTTFESPFEPYVAHYPMHYAAALPAETVAPLRQETADRLEAAVGGDVETRRLYHAVLLDSMVHELNALRGVLGEPDRVDFADLGRHGANIGLRFGERRAILTWVDLPGFARYQMEFAFFAPDRRLTLAFPSPYLRNAAATFTKEVGVSGTAESSSSTHHISYEAGFKAELVHFHDCIVNRATPRTPATDALQDVVLCGAILRAHRTGAPVANPSSGIAA